MRDSDGASTTAEVAASGSVIDTFEDAGQYLKVETSGSSPASNTIITVIYRDQHAQVRKVTVEPDCLTATGASAFDAFLSTIDPDFLSFVRSVIGDHMMHLAARPTTFEQATVKLFFPPARGKAVGARAAEYHEGIGAPEVMVEIIPTAID